MDDEENRPRSRNVTAKDIVAIFVVFGLLLPLIWFKESGEKWATYLIAITPVVGLAYWLETKRVFFDYKE